VNRIDRKLKHLKSQGKKAFIAYVTAGDPTMAMTEKIVSVLESSGADMVELGIPFSDPMADGPVIQAASQRALAGGATLAKAFGLVERIRKTSQVPIIFMTYFNPVLKYGLADFFARCRKSGVDGVIVADLPLEESGELADTARKSGVFVILLVAPTSGRKRIKMIVKKSTGFIYYVSLTGVTGSRGKLPSEISAAVKIVKSMTAKPVAVGFGVSNPQQAREIAKTADGVIIGSAIVRIIGEKKNMIQRISKLAKGLSEAIHNV